MEKRVRQELEEGGRKIRNNFRGITTKKSTTKLIVVMIQLTEELLRNGRDISICFINLEYDKFGEFEKKCDWNKNACWLFFVVIVDDM